MHQVCRIIEAPARVAWRVLIETREWPTLGAARARRGGLGAALESLAPHRDALVGVVVESIFNWHWLVDALMEAGYRVHLANTAALVQDTGLKYSDDD